MKIKKIYALTNYKKPLIRFVFENGTKKHITLNCSEQKAIETANQLNIMNVTGNLKLSDYFCNNNYTLQQLKEDYLQHRSQKLTFNQIKKPTYETDKYSLDILIEVLGSSFKISNFNADTFNYFANTLLTKKTNQYNNNYSPTSINTYRAHLSGAFSWAVKHNKIDSNPLLEIEKLRTKRKARRDIKTDELIALYQYFKTKPHWQLDTFVLDIFTGIRESVIPQLKADDLGYRLINETLIYVLSFYTKNDKYQELFCPPQAVEILKRRMEWIQDPEKIPQYLSPFLSPSKYPFYIERARQRYLFFDVANKTSICHAFVDAKKALNLEGISFHSIRHTYTSFLKKLGTPTAIVSHSLGHSDVKTTDIYTHMDLSYFAEHPEIFDNMNQIIFGKK